MQNSNEAEQKPDILDAEYNSYEAATTGQRFVNFLIDWLFINFAFSYVTGFMVAYLLLWLSPDSLQEIAAAETYGGSYKTVPYYVFVIATSWLGYLMYYSFSEKLFRGYTLGKLVSGTRAVNEDGSELSFKDAFMRSLCRIVPFEPFSGFSGYPWHDQWTKTAVIKTR